MRRTAFVALVSLVAANLPAISAGPDRRFSRQLSKTDQIAHALNRLTFGPRPGDAARVRTLRLKRWIDLQLHPARIVENPILAAKLQTLDSLAMSSAQLVENYPPPQLVRQMLAGTVPFPSDPNRRFFLERLAGASAPDNPAVPPLARALRTGTAPDRLSAFRSLPPAQQDELIVSLPPAARQALFRVSTPEIRRRIELASGPPQVPARDLAEAKLLRAVYSHRQLQEVLVDFWYNHFNVFLDKGADRYLVTAYERDVIRPHVLGTFQDLLEATAKSPAMLFYLDNWRSAGPPPPGRSVNPNRTRRGLNENYGRELLELHTLGVDGGYTQTDVTEVARCFTGWTIEQPQRGGAFTFNPRLHDTGGKKVLGVTIPAGGGMEDGLKVLDILAHHPSTAHFLSWKLAQRFVADDPPPALVDRMARTFLKTGGDLRKVMHTMLASKEFRSVAAFRSKIKSPLELVASALRASGAEIDYASLLVNQVARLGQPLYRKQEPTGYSNAGREWMNSAGLLARINFAVQLAGNRVAGVKVDGAIPATELGSPEFQKK